MIWRYRYVTDRYCTVRYGTYSSVRSFVAHYRIRYLHLPLLMCVSVAKLVVFGGIHWCGKINLFHYRIHIQSKRTLNRWGYGTVPLPPYLLFHSVLVNNALNPYYLFRKGQTVKKVFVGGLKVGVFVAFCRFFYCRKVSGKQSNHHPPHPHPQLWDHTDKSNFILLSGVIAGIFKKSSFCYSRYKKYKARNFISDHGHELSYLHQCTHTEYLPVQVPVLYISVPDPNPDPPDPHVFGPPGSGSISQRYGFGSGSGSFYHHAKIGKKNFDSYYFCVFFWLFIFGKWCKCTFQKWWAEIF